MYFYFKDYADFDEDHYDSAYGDEEPNRLKLARLNKISRNENSTDVPIENPYYGQEPGTLLSHIESSQLNSGNMIQNVKVSENPYYAQ